MTNYGKLAKDYSTGVVNPNVRPEKGVRNDAAGIAFELAVKKWLGLAEEISPQGEVDVVFGKLSFEVKQGSAILWKVDEDGAALEDSPMLNSDCIIYSFNYDGTEESLFDSWIIPIDNFIAELGKVGMIRYKKSSAMLKKPKEKQYYDCLTIKDLNRCKSGRRRLEEAFKEYLTFSEYYNFWRQEQ